LPKRTGRLFHEANDGKESDSARLVRPSVSEDL